MIVGDKVGSGVDVMVGSRVFVGSGVAEGCGVSVDVCVGIAVERPGVAQPERIKRRMDKEINRSLFKAKLLK
jgi:hypothetical protein